DTVVLIIKVMRVAGGNVERDGLRAGRDVGVENCFAERAEAAVAGVRDDEARAAECNNRGKFRGGVGWATAAVGNIGGCGGDERFAAAPVLHEQIDWNIDGETPIAAGIGGAIE